MKNFMRRFTLLIRRLKLWQKVLIGFLLIGALGSIVSSQPKSLKLMVNGKEFSCEVSDKMKTLDDCINENITVGERDVYEFNSYDEVFDTTMQLSEYWKSNEDILKLSLVTEECSKIGDVTIEFEKVIVNDDTKLDSFSEVTQNGINGSGSKVECSKIVDNKVVKIDVSVDIVKEPVNEIVTVGTLNPYNYLITELTSLINKGIAFDTGNYVKGDIPKGEYFFLGLSDNGSYYSEETASGSIIDNEIFPSFGYVYVHGAGNISTDGVLVPIDKMTSFGFNSGVEIYEAFSGIENYNDEGFYKIGIDLPAGTYTFTSYGPGYIAILSGPVGNGRIVDNELVEGRYSVKVKKGQYLEVSNGYVE